ncbi:hypothetical protein MALU111345_03590 [Marinicrinis lubricantis]
MKLQKLFLAVTAVMLASSTPAAMAEYKQDPASGHMHMHEAPALDESKRMEMLVATEQEWHTLNKLMMEKLEKKKQAVQKRDELLTLIVSAAKKGDTEALKKASEIRGQMGMSHENRKSTGKAVHEAMRAAHEAGKTGDTKQVKVHLKEAISGFEQSLDQMDERLKQMDQAIQALK